MNPSSNRDADSEQRPDWFGYFALIGVILAYLVPTLVVILGG